MGLKLELVLLCLFALNELGLDSSDEQGVNDPAMYRGQ